MNSTSVEGLYLVENFLRPKEEEELIKQVLNGDWKTNRFGTRRVQTSGLCHDLSFRSMEGFTPHPEYSKDVVAMIEELREDIPETRVHLTDEFIAKISDPQRSELFINEYIKGDSLYSHHDNRTTYGDCIIGISLLSDVEMEFAMYKTAGIRILIPQRSLYLMTGKARYVYKHGIPHIKQTRLSLTYRTILNT